MLRFCHERNPLECHIIYAMISHSHSKDHQTVKKHEFIPLDLLNMFFLLLFKMYWPNAEREFYEHIFIAFPNDVTMFGK